MEKSSVFDVWTDTLQSDLAKKYNKTPQAMYDAIKRMKKALNRDDLTYTKDGKKWVTGIGVEWLDKHLEKQQYAVSNDNEEIIRLRAELDAAIKFNDEIKSQYTERIQEAQKHHETELALQLRIQAVENEKLLLEDKSTIDVLKAEIEAKNDELERLKNRSFFERVFNK